MTEEIKPPRFVLSNAAELLAKPEPSIEWLIENIWVNGARGLIAGNPGVGKTWLALDMLIAVASGGLCLGRFPTRRGAVLLVEEEGSELNLSRRLHAMARARGLTASDLSNMYILSRQFTKIPADMAALFTLMAPLDIKLVVFDSLRRFHNCDENSSSEMQSVLDSFGRLNVASGASVVLIHHLAKGGRESDRRPIFERLRGSSDFWAWRDCLIGVEGEEESDTALCSFQFRDAESPEPFMFKRFVSDLTGAIGLDVVDVQSTEEFNERAERIMAYVRTQFGSVSRNQINENVKGKKGDILRTIKAMIKQNMLAKDGLKLVVPEMLETSGNHGN